MPSLQVLFVHVEVRLQILPGRGMQTAWLRWYAVKHRQTWFALDAFIAFI
jgi:hypothetical protein